MFTKEPERYKPTTEFRDKTADRLMIKSLDLDKPLSSDKLRLMNLLNWARRHRIEFNYEGAIKAGRLTKKQFGYLMHHIRRCEMDDDHNTHYRRD